MTMKSMAGSGETESRFYLHNQELALQWEKYAQSIHGKIDGEYNAYVVNFDLEAHHKNALLSVQGTKELKAVTSNAIPIDSAISGMTKLKMRLEMPYTDAFVIKKKSFLSSISKLFGNPWHPLNENYIVQTEDFDLFMKVMSKSDAGNELMKFPFTRMEVNPLEKEITVQFHQFILPEKIDHLQELLLKAVHFFANVPAR